MQGNVELDLRTPIGRVVRAWREERSLTVTELAARATQARARLARARGEADVRSISKGYVSGLERDQVHNPGADILEAIAAALDLPSAYPLVNRRFPGDNIPSPPQQASPQPFSPTRTVGQPTGFNMPSRSIPQASRPTLDVPRKISQPLRASGRQIEELVTEARLTDEEQLLLGERLVGMTGELVALIKAVRELKGKTEP